MAKMKPKSSRNQRGDTIFDAVQRADAALVKSLIQNGADLSATDKSGFTPLHRAVALEDMPVKNVLETTQALLEGGSPLEALEPGGRTPLYLCAEYTKSLAPIEMLVSAGANPNVSVDGAHVTKNARSTKVKRYLSDLTAVAIVPVKREKRSKPLMAAQWSVAKRRLSRVFAALNKAQLIALEKAGTTQDDGLDDCSQAYHGLASAEKKKIAGFCFYTEQDVASAKALGGLPIAFWGAPRGAVRATQKVGQQIVDAFVAEGFAVAWDGTSDTRPIVDLHSIG